MVFVAGGVVIQNIFCSSFLDSLKEDNVFDQVWPPDRRAVRNCTVALSTSYSINLGWRLIKSSRTQRYQNAKAIQHLLYSLCILVSLGT